MPDGILQGLASLDWNAVAAIAAVLGLGAALYAVRQSAAALRCAREANRIARGSALNQWIMERITEEFAAALTDRDIMRSLCAPMPAVERGDYVRQLREGRDASAKRMQLLELVDDRASELTILCADRERVWDSCLDTTTVDLPVSRANDLATEHERQIRLYVERLKGYVGQCLDGDPELEPKKRSLPAGDPHAPKRLK